MRPETEAAVAAVNRDIEQLTPANKLRFAAKLLEDGYTQHGARVAEHVVAELRMPRGWLTRAPAPGR